MIFFDFEVFKHDWLVVLYDDVSGVETRIHNDTNTLTTYRLNHKQDVWIGYNAKNYDQYILGAIIRHKDPKKVSDGIFAGNRESIFGTKLDSLLLFDAMTAACASRSLKQLEGYAGMDIRETSVPFNIDRALTPEEVEETFTYCAHDVAACREVFQTISKPAYDAQDFFIRNYTNYVQPKDISLTQAQLAACMLCGNYRGKSFKDADKFSIADSIRIERYAHVLAWRKSEAGRSESAELKDEPIAGIPHTFSEGGLHGARDNYRYTGKILILDVTAYYPSIMAAKGYGRRVINDWTMFLEIHNANLEFKRKGDKTARQPYKIMDNAITGQLKQQASRIYDPRANREICINGQLMLLDLIERLEDCAGTALRLIQTNTDGLMYELCNNTVMDAVHTAVHDWESRTGVSMDETIIDGTIVQKDVNNYMVIDENGNVIKSKGRDVKPCGPADNTLAIVRKAICDWYGKGIRPEDTINGCDRLIDFQQVIKLSPKFDKLRLGETELPERTLRVFASNDLNAGGLTQHNIEKDTWSKVPGTPDCCFFVNSDIRGTAVPEDLNRAWYTDLAYRTIYAWTGEILHKGDAATEWELKAIQKAEKNQTESPTKSNKASVSKSIAAIIDTIPVKKQFDDYTQTEIAGAALRYMRSKGINLAGMYWQKRTNFEWVARIQAPEDGRGEYGYSLNVHMDKPTCAKLFDYRTWQVRETWMLKDDPAMKGGWSAAPSFDNIDKNEKPPAHTDQKEPEPPTLSEEEPEDDSAKAIAVMRERYKAAAPLSADKTGPGVEYLKAKGVLEYAIAHDTALRVDSEGRLLVPYTIQKGVLGGLQSIVPGDTGKRWAAGVSIPKDAKHIIPGKSQLPVIILAEGLATGLSIHQRCKSYFTVVVCGNCGRMESIGITLAQAQPKSKIKLIVAADNDTGTEEKTGRNPGLEAAKKIKEANPDRVIIEIAGKPEA